MHTALTPNDNAVLAPAVLAMFAALLKAVIALRPFIPHYSTLQNGLTIAFFVFVGCAVVMAAIVTPPACEERCND